MFSLFRDPLEDMFECPQCTFPKNSSIGVLEEVSYPQSYSPKVQIVTLSGCCGSDCLKAVCLETKKQSLAPLFVSLK